MSKLYSSRHIVRVLERQGFIFIDQRGSYAKYRKVGMRTFTVIVPAKRKEVPRGTLRSILRQSGLCEGDFE
ncbi:MAG: hypothetical protein A3C07_03870 [Candidatus Sungbacteria bacterium RIFCSPHIGHO2_02_FULL_47_11]|uniref:Addiction module toxin, HicA family n=1 Tax=Candidatus Sungbacteria bacterium RIFCSPHIGHO2_02_FULL_47_11 TaxID=1802270 RepID=A0A1G2KJK0_9BACT|nr:MAG: hypothetical protein A3C07_03870 [Candidatus Sungbacteria bacterium RIFCSPHIGHO2_02_FULL_47_11]